MIESTTVRPGDGWYRIAGRIAPGAKTSTVGEYLARANGDTPTTPVHAGRILWFDTVEIARFLGGAPPIGDIPGWRQVFTDDFATDIPVGQFVEATKGRWSAYPSPWPDTARVGRHDPAKTISVSGGILEKFLRVENGIPLVAAIQPMNGQGMLYGRYQIRARFDPIPGYAAAWLLWPKSETWPRDGEVDFPEMTLTSKYVNGFVHRQGAVVGSDQAAFRHATDPTQWHTYTTEWTPNLVVFYCDGVEVGRTTDRVPNTPMRWVLQTETSYGTVPPATAAGRVQIDWVSMWAYAP